MTRTTTTLAILVALSSLATAKTMKANPENAVRKTFASYTEAVAAKDGKRVVTLVDKATIAHYGKIIRHALESDKATLGKLPMVDRLTVLRVRIELPADKLSKMNGKDLVRYGVEQGWSQEWRLDKTAIDSISVDGKKATVETSGGRLGDSIKWKLLRDSKAWRVSVVSVLPAANALMQKMAKRFGKSEDELVELAVQMLSGKKISPTIWDPLK